ncbi:tetratricopeptide repeat protein [Cytobacillus firmus]|uniref:tetratricopeptide repeat protein n=1 Tax=Cytobacillus firmus TaxID=1399 RepID=UPI0021CADA9A|nr:tetratricopeptide repeat protein [Cytobacillus firmus]MCU1808260.1 tetratricopeptide repeat protein [Cytobacillus firmus]
MRYGGLLAIFLLFIFLAGCIGKYDDYLQKGKNSLENEEFAKAVDYLEQALKEKKTAEAEQLYAEAKDKSKISKLLTEGKDLTNKKQFNEAISIYTSILKDYENKEYLDSILKETQGLLNVTKTKYGEALLTMANTAIQGGEYSYAKKNLSKILDMDIENSEVKQLLMFCENMINGTNAYNNQEWDEAISLFSVALNTYPDHEKAISMKKEALDNKKSLEIADNMAGYENEEAMTNEVDFEETDVTVNEDEDIQSNPAEDAAKIEFVNVMNSLLNDYWSNVMNQIQGISSGMTSITYLQMNLGNIYRESVNVAVPYPEYQEIMNNWMTCLEETNVYLEVLQGISNGDFSALSQENIFVMADYYEKTLDGLNSIQ